MDAGRLLQFFENAGFNTVREGSTHWFEAGPKFLLAIPSHQPIRPSPEQRRRLLRRGGVLGLRYVTEADGGGRPSHQIVASGSYELESLSASARSKVRRGLKRNTIRQISGTELAKVGEQSVIDTLKRQGRFNNGSVNAWRRLLKAADMEPAVEIWSAWHDDELAAYLLVTLVDDVCDLLQSRSLNRLLGHYPNNALIFSVTHDMLMKRGFREVTFGLDSLTPTPTLDAFKATLGFVHKPIYQRVVLHPVLDVVLRNTPVGKIFDKLAGFKGAPMALRKASDLIHLATGEEGE